MVGSFPEATPNQAQDQQLVEEVSQARQIVMKELSKRIVGQREVIEHLMIALLARGHCLFVGVPGLAKTSLIATLADLFNLTFSRIQFTPDLMPADITGTDVLQEDTSSGRRFFRFIKGPIFANVVLADEINRTPPKTQAALLQAMQEQRVTAGGTTYELALPFLVLATQNPIEQEGTYPLPEAQLDRFMFQVNVTYPSEQEEVDIVKRGASAYSPPLQKIFHPEEIQRLQSLIIKVPVADHAVRYAVKLCRSSRPQSASAPKMIRDYVSWGVGPRATQFLVIAAKARAILQGRYAVNIEDIQALVPPVFQHRLVRNFRAEAEGITACALIEHLLSAVQK